VKVEAIEHKGAMTVVLRRPITEVEVSTITLLVVLVKGMTVERSAKVAEELDNAD
jgi:hypothetical protein